MQLECRYLYCELGAAPPDLNLLLNYLSVIFCTLRGVAFVLVKPNATAVRSLHFTPLHPHTLTPPPHSHFTFTHNT